MNLPAESPTRRILCPLQRAVAEGVTGVAEAVALVLVPVLALDVPALVQEEDDDF